MEVARAIAADVLGRAPDAVAPITGTGSVNRVFRVEAGDRRLILRLPTDDDLWRAAAFYAKEAWCLERAAARGIPSPVVLAQGERDGWPFQVLSFVDGVPGTQADPAYVWRALGDYARRFHTVALDGFGETLDDFQTGDGRTRWRRFVEYNVASLTDDDPLVALGVYPPAARDALRERFAALRDWETPMGLNHGDLSPRNTIVADDGTVTLLDWGCAEAHLAPHYDLMLLRTCESEPVDFDAFCDGYGLTASARDALLPALDDLALLKAFDLTRWAIDRCPARTDEIAARARRRYAAVATGPKNSEAAKATR